MPAGGHSTLSDPESGRWHPAVLDVVEAVDELAYSNSVLFHQSLGRTKGTGRPHQDWAVAFGYDGTKSVAGWLITEVAVITVSSDCKTTCTGNAHNCRDGAEPKTGKEGDTAREADKVVINCMKLMARFQRERDLLYSGDHIDDG